MNQHEIHSRIADALARLGAITRAHEQRESQSEAISPLQSRALVVLHRRKALRIGELARELLVSYGTISVAVAALEQKGLVTRSADAEEHRAVNVALTRRGLRLARAADQWQAQLLEPAVADLDETTSARLLATLLHLLRSLERQGLISTTRMCLSCRYFEPGGGKDGRPHYCGLLEASIGNAELRVDCPEHETASAERLEELGRAFGVSS